MPKSTCQVTSGHLQHLAAHSQDLQAGPKKGAPPRSRGYFRPCGALPPPRPPPGLEAAPPRSPATPYAGYLKAVRRDFRAARHCLTRLRDAPPSIFFGFSAAPDPGDPIRSPGPAPHITFHEKSAPQTNSKAMSLRVKIPAGLPGGSQGELILPGLSALLKRKRNVRRPSRSRLPFLDRLREARGSDRLQAQLDSHQKSDLGAGFNGHFVAIWAWDGGTASVLLPVSTASCSKIRTAASRAGISVITTSRTARVRPVS